jgi:hypothetical protein
MLPNPLFPLAKVVDRECASAVKLELKDDFGAA